MSFLNNNSSEKSTIVITGGASGIGLALAKQLVKLGHEVIAVGRRAAQLSLATSEVPGLKTVQGDVSTETGRIALHKSIISDYPSVNVLINNAGVSGVSSLLKELKDDDWTKYQEQINVNLTAPIHLSILFLPHLQTKPHALIANVSSMVAFFPFIHAPVYSATKAALHSFTISLRYQLKNTSVKLWRLHHLL